MWSIMWRLRRRAAGRCTVPYAGAAVGAMYGPYRRRASGDAAVARVVGCTVARPLVRILVRGGCGFCCRSRGGALAHSCPTAPLGFVVSDCQCGVGCNSLGGGAVCFAYPPPGVGLFYGLIRLCRVVIRAPQKGNPPAPVVMQGDAVSGYGF